MTGQQATTTAIRPRLVSTNLKNGCGSWIRLCPQWFCTGMPAHWTSIEARRA